MKISTKSLLSATGLSAALLISAGVVLILVLGVGPGAGQEPHSAARTGLYDTPWPTPGADLWRTNAVSGADLLADLE